MDIHINIINSASTDHEASGRSDVQDGIPPSFSLLPDGVHLEIAPNDPQWICSPLRVAALFCDQAGKNWGRLVQVQDRHGKWHALPVLDGELSRSAAAILSNLQGLGLRVPREKGRHEMVSTLIADWAPTRHLVTAGRLGWADEAMTSFVLGGGRAVGPVEVLPVGNALTTLADQIRARGSRIGLGKPAVGGQLALNGKWPRRCGGGQKLDAARP